MEEFALGALERHACRSEPLQNRVEQLAEAVGARFGTLRGSLGPVSV